MPRQGKRRKVAKGIYRDGSGLAAVCCGKEKRFPPGTPLKELRAWQDRLRVKRRGSGTGRAARGTLNAAIDTWAALEQHLASWKERRAELRAWGEMFGTRRLGSLTALDVRRAMSDWAQAGVAPKTIRNRLWSLRHLFHVINGKGTETPCDDIDPPPMIRTVPTPVTPAVILAVYQRLVAMEQDGTLRNAKQRARFMVLASTGRRPSEMKRAQPGDVDLEQRIWRVRDGKGGWSEGLYLNGEMVTAWQTFIDANAWGDFRTEGLAKTLRAAGWPEDVRPYNLRHSVGIDLSESGTDLADVSAWLGHTRVQTTRSFYVPVLKSRMQRSAERLEGRLSGWK